MQTIPSEKFHRKFPQAELIYIPNFFSVEEANALFQKLLEDTPWQHDNITVFGKTYPQPRLTALFGKNSKPYSYSGITMNSLPYSKTLQAIDKKIEQEIAHKFTTVLMNLYRNGNDSNGWHADNEKELGKNPVIASVSFGAERFFHFKHRLNKALNYKLLLGHGSLLVMKGEMQHFWLHQLPKTKQTLGERINLTFRSIN